MFVGAFFRTRNILTRTSFLEQGIFTCLFICVGDNIKLDIGLRRIDSRCRQTDSKQNDPYADDMAMEDDFETDSEEDDD